MVASYRAGAQGGLCANDEGLPEVRVGVRSFGCMGATPPLDHPHVYLNMGPSDWVVCPYCSTRFVYTPKGEGSPLT